MVWLVPLVSGIQVPSGKQGPITPPRPTPRYVNPHAPSAPAPVVEYSADHPEPPPLDPSYVPHHFDYFQTLRRHHVYYVPVKYRNFNGLSNHIDYEPPQKVLPYTLGKNVAYKPYKYPGYFPVNWSNQYDQSFAPPPPPPASTQYTQNTVQYAGQPSNQYTQQTNQYPSQVPNQNSNQSNQNNNVYVQSNQNNQNNNQYVQPTQQQPQYEAAAASTAAPGSTQDATPAVVGKGSYDVTGKGGSRSEYYDKDWSKKSIYPKKVLDQRLKKHASHKY